MTPPLPSLRALTAELRELHEVWTHPEAGGEYVGLTLAKRSPTRTPHGWKVRCCGDSDRGELQFGREYVPGDGAPFDAVAAARRLLATARDGIPSNQSSDASTAGGDLP